jgi:hypothetical protein
MLLPSGTLSILLLICPCALLPLLGPAASIPRQKWRQWQ